MILSASIVGANIRLDWTFTGNVNGFNIYRDGVAIAQVGKTIRTFIDSQTVSGVSYAYQVATYGHGAAQYSNIVNALVPIPISPISAALNLGLTGFATVSQGSPNMTKYVDGNLAGDIPDYSVANRSGGGNDGFGYKTVQSAIGAAANDEVIYVRGGSYTGRVQVSSNPVREMAFNIVKPLTLQGFNNESPILTYDPNNIPLEDANNWAPIVMVQQPNTYLRDLKVIGTKALGDSPGGGDVDVNVRVNGGAGVYLYNCILTDFGHAGLKADSMGGFVKIVGGRISDGGFNGRDHCVYIAATSAAGRVILDGVEFARAAGYGLHFYGTPRGCVVDACNIHHNGGVYGGIPNGGGILVNGTGGHLVRNCQVVDNIGYGGVVLWKAESTGNVFIGNTILRNTTYNIVFDQAGIPNFCYLNTRHAFPASGLGRPTDPLQWPDYGTDVIA